MSNPKFSGKKAAIATAKRTAAKPSAKATTSKPVAKGFGSKIGDEVKAINEKYGIAAMLPQTKGKMPKASVPNTTDNLLLAINQKLEIIIELLKMDKD